MPVAKKTTQTKAKSDLATPPNFQKRNEFGLYPHIKYHFKEDGSVDWRKMVDPDALYVNKFWFERRNEDVPEKTDSLDDDQLVIRQWGLRELMKLRGFHNISLRVVDASNANVSFISSIDWIGNYETDHNSITTEESANANIINCSQEMSKFLEAIASNRALTRNIRMFLGIYVVSEDEIDTNPLEKQESIAASSGSAQFAASNLAPTDSLRKMVKEYWKMDSFEGFIAAFKDEKCIMRHAMMKSHPQFLDEIEDWSDFTDISFATALVMVRELEKQLSKTKK